MKLTTYRLGVNGLVRGVCIDVVERTVVVGLAPFDRHFGISTLKWLLELNTNGVYLWDYETRMRVL